MDSTAEMGLPTEDRFDIGDLEQNRLNLVCSQATGLVGRKPYDLLEQLADLSAQRGSKALGVMEAPPVTFVAEGDHALLKFGEGGLSHQPRNLT